MKCSGKMKVSLKPSIFIDPKSLAKARYMISKHPKECQWFFRVHKDLQEDLVCYHLYDFLVPEQTCSGADVESDPQMMYKLFQELRTEQDLSLEEISDIISSTTCWCHSHVHMGAKPSLQDDKQWAEQKKLTLDSGSNAPQLMLIFNKRDEYFSRVFDPEFNLEFENVSLQLVENTDFSAEIDIIIKTKLKIKSMARKVNRRPASLVPTSYPWEGLFGAQGSKKKENDTLLYPPLIEEKPNISLDETSVLDYHSYRELQELSDRLDTPNETIARETAEKITETLDNIIDEEDYQLLISLLFDTTTDMMLIADWVADNSDSYTGNEKNNFVEFCINIGFTAPDLLTDAVETLLAIRSFSDEEDIKQALEWWATFRDENEKEILKQRELQ
jgi:hypothetical protein